MVHPGQQDDGQGVIARLEADEQLSASGGWHEKGIAGEWAQVCITHRSCPEKSSKSQDQLRVARLRDVDEHATHGSRGARQVVAAGSIGRAR